MTHFRRLAVVLCVASAPVTAVAGGYVAPTVQLFPVSAPVAAAPAVTSLCSEPVVCAAVALAVMALLIDGDEKAMSHVAPPVVVPPLPGPGIDPAPQPMPVPLPASGILLAAAFAATLLLQVSRSQRSHGRGFQVPGSGWVGHDPAMPPGGYDRGTALLDKSSCPRRHRFLQPTLNEVRA